MRTLKHTFDFRFEKQIRIYKTVFVFCTVITFGFHDTHLCFKTQMWIYKIVFMFCTRIKFGFHNTYVCFEKQMRFFKIKQIWFSKNEFGFQYINQMCVLNINVVFEIRFSS